MRFFSKPVDVSKIRHLYPFKSHFAEIDGHQYHYVDEGAGEPVVMVHGNPTWSFYYRELIQALCHRYRTIAMDHVGCGLSDKPPESQYSYRLDQRIHDLKKFIDYLKLEEKLTLVLHDWGGMIGLAYALGHLHRIHKIVLLNTAAFFPPAGRPLPWRLKLIRSNKVLARVAVLNGNVFVRAALLMATAKGLQREVRKGLAAPYNCPQNRLATLKFVEDIPLTPADPSFATVKNVQESLYRLKEIPVQICWGMKDFVFTRVYLDEWRRRLPDATVDEFKDAGHYVLEDAKDQVVDRIRRFMLGE